MNEKLSIENTNGRGKKSDDLQDIIKFTIIAILIVIPIRMYIAQPFIVSGESMVPTFQNGEYLIIDEISYRFNEPERGDVIVFRFPNDTKRFFIKRIIGLPGETIKMRGSKVEILTLDEKRIVLEEGYINGEFGSHEDKKLEDGEYFVMGDNRMASSDSRSWGSLSKKYIIGKALVRVFPLGSIGLHPGSIEPEEIEIIQN